MKGELRYYEPDAEINYLGGWAVNEGEGINKVTYKLSDDSMKWILENKPSKLMDVEFTVVPNCYFYEDTKRGTHQLVAELSFVDKVKTFTIKDLEKAFKAGRETYSKPNWGNDFDDAYTYDNFKDYQKLKIK
jgi:hypothetical protein